MVSPLDRYAVPTDELRFDYPGFTRLRHETYSIGKVKMGHKAAEFLYHESLSPQTAAEAFLEVVAWELGRDGQRPLSTARRPNLHGGLGSA